jgi:hypothetical protein
MNISEIITLLGGITTAINAIFLGYLAMKRLKPELKKADAEGNSEYAEATNINLEGAKISGLILLDRINELKGELGIERTKREQSELAHQKDIAAMTEINANAIATLEKGRRDDREYFKRRIKDLETELRDYRLWAAKLAKQVVEAGKIPAPLVPTVGESETGITAIRTDLEGTTDEKKAYRK